MEDEDLFEEVETTPSAVMAEFNTSLTTLNQVRQRQGVIQCADKLMVVERPLTEINQETQMTTDSFQTQMRTLGQRQQQVNAMSYERQHPKKQLQVE